MLNEMEELTIGNEVKWQLTQFADQYETAEFLNGDPSWFMHQVSGRENQEAMAFVASSLSYGSRKQFMQRIQLLLDWSGGKMDAWIRSGEFAKQLPEASEKCFYRLYTVRHMNRFLEAYRKLLVEYGSLGEYVRAHANDGFTAIAAISQYFSQQGISVVIPKDTTSACKRVCMFLRWMVRSGSPVDLGLWADFIDRRTLIIPLDTHVLQQSARMGLLTGKSANMATARRLTDKLATIFPDDPLKGDFALFGYGVSS